MSDSSQSTTGADTAPDPNRWIALATLLIAGFMNLIDITIVNVALPRLQESLGATSSQIEWVVAGYVLAFALGLLPFGRLGDIVGRRRMFLIGVGAFALFSVLCGMAPSIELLVIARVAQGLAGATMMPQVLAITQNIFPPEERGAAFSLFGLSASLAAVTGPLLGGILISADLFGLDWRPIFLINLPIGIFAIIAGLRLIPPIPGNRGMTNDFVGIVLACFTVFLLVYPLIEGRNYDWPLWAFAMMAASLPSAFAFVLWEGWRERQGRSQLLPISLMRNRGYVLGVIMAMAFFSGIPGFFMIFALFLQTGFGFTALESGLTTMPFPIGIFTASLLSNRLGPNFLKQRLIFGSLILLGGMIFTRMTVLGVGDAVDHWSFVTPLVIAGFGMGLTIAVLFQAILTNVDPRDTGSGSGALQAFQQMGGAIGVALIGEIFFSTLTAGGRPEHADFVSAVSHAMIYNIAIFVAFAIMALFLQTPTRRGGARSGRERSGTVAEA